MGAGDGLMEGADGGKMDGGDLERSEGEQHPSGDEKMKEEEEEEDEEDKYDEPNEGGTFGGEGIRQNYVEEAEAFSDPSDVTAR